jgi:hypothetical protein
LSSIYDSIDKTQNDLNSKLASGDVSAEQDAATNAKAQALAAIQSIAAQLKGVGPFSANITVPPALTLMTPVNNAAVKRSNGLPVTWTGGVANEYVQIEVNAPTDSTCTTGASAVCTVPGTAGTFTIPSYVLMALPATPLGVSGGLVLSMITLNSFTATGLAIELLQTYTNAAGFGYGWGSGSFNLQ